MRLWPGTAEVHDNYTVSVTPGRRRGDIFEVVLHAATRGGTTEDDLLSNRWCLRNARDCRNTGAATTGGRKGTGAIE